MAKQTQLALLLAATPIVAHAHSTSTSGTALHAFQHGSLAVGYLALLALAVFGMVRVIRKVRQSK